ncbi:MAG: hypothetical protein DPW16_02960 [Chloroflexi bacterium]|nr:hypothetical protein [Chloroflexota bacterium]
MNNQSFEEQITNAMRNIPEPNPAQENAARAAFLAEARHMREHPYRLWQRPHSRKWMIAAAAILIFLIGGFALSVQNIRQANSDATVQAEVIPPDNNPSLHQNLTPTPTQEQIGVSPITAENAAQLVELQQFGTGTMNGAVWSPDGKELALYGALGIWFYDTSDFDTTPRFVESDTYINDAAYSPDGTLFATATNDGSVNLLVANTSTIKMKIEAHQGRALHLAFSPDGQIIASTGDEDKSVRVWSVETGRELIVFSDFFANPMSVEALSFSPDGMTLAAAGMKDIYTPVDREGFSRWSVQPAVLVWDIEQKNLVTTLLGMDERISDLAYSNDSKQIAASTWNGSIYIWNIAKNSAAIQNEPLITLRDSVNQLNGIAYSPTEHILASVSFGGQVQLWSVADQETTETLPIELDGESIRFDNPVGVEFSPDGQKLAAWDLNGPVIIWNILPTGDSSVETIIRAFNDPFAMISASSDSSRVAAGTQIGYVAVWDLQTGELTANWLPDEPNIFLYDIQFKPNSPLLAIGLQGGEKGLDIWDTSNSGQTVPEFATDYLNPADYLTGYAATQVDFNQDGRQMVSAGAFSEDVLTLWDVDSGEPRGSLSIPNSSDSFYLISDLVFSPDNKTVIFLQTENRALLVWDSTHPEDYRLVEGHSGYVTVIAITADGTMLASVDMEQNLILWDTATWQETAYIKNIGGNSALAFSQDGQLLAIAGYDGEIYLWNTNTLSLVTTLHGHTTQVTDMVFTHDGTRLISSSFDGTVRVWGLQ